MFGIQRKYAKSSLSLLLAPLLWCASAPRCAAAPVVEDVIRIGVRAENGLDAVLESWGPTMRALSDSLAPRKVELVPVADLDELRRELLNSDLDFVFASPTDSVDFQMRAQARQIATLQISSEHGSWTGEASAIFCVAGNSDFDQLGDLRGGILMGVSSTSFCGWRIAYRDFLGSGFDPFEQCELVTFSSDGNPTTVIEAVRIGKVDVGVVCQQVLTTYCDQRGLPRDTFQLVQGVAKAEESYPGMALSVGMGTAQDDQDAVLAALFELRVDGVSVWTPALDYKSVHELLRDIGAAPYVAPPVAQSSVDFILANPRKFGGAAAAVLLGLAAFLGRVLYLNRALYRAHRDLWQVQGGLKQRIEEQTAELRDERDHFLSIFDGMPECVFVSNQSGTLLYANEEMRTIFGDSVGRSCFSVLREGQAACDSCPSERVFEGRTRLSLWLDAPDGRTYECYETAISHGDEPKTKLTILRDVTDRYHAEQELRENEAAFRKQALVFENSTDAIVITDSCGLVVDWNGSSERVFGYSRVEVQGKHVDVIHPGPEIVTVLREISDSIAAEGRWQGELPFRSKDGTCGVCEAAIVSLRDASGAHLGSVGVHRDVTQRRLEEAEHEELERQFQQSQKLESLGVLAGGMAHDFNNILMAILGNVDLALDSLSGDSPCRQNMLEIQAASKRAAGLAGQMLAYSGRGKFVVTSIDFGALIGDMSQRLGATVPESAEMVYVLDSGLPAVNGDAGQLQQVIANLVANASEALEEGRGTITLSTGLMECDEEYLADINPVIHASLGEPPPAGSYVYLQVSDTGKGMGEATLERIFEPFFTTKFTGRGLGLAAVLGIILGHKGTLHVDSEVGVGTTIRVLLPASKSLIPMLAAPQSGQPPPGNSSEVARPCILIVDDEDSVRGVGALMLTRLGYDVLEACDGQEALDVLAGDEGERVDLILLDLTMPRLDGEATFYELKRLGCSARIVMCSGYSNKSAVEGFLKDGLNGFLPKPYGLSDLRRTIQETLKLGTIV